MTQQRRRPFCLDSSHKPVWRSILNVAQLSFQRGGGRAPGVQGSDGNPRKRRGDELAGQDGGFYSQPVTFMGTTGTRVVAAESIEREDGIAAIKSHPSACKLHVY